MAPRTDFRFFIGTAGLLLLFLLLGARLFQLQVLEGQTYRALASDQHDLQAALIPRRGTIYVRERGGGELRPLVQDRETWSVYAVKRELQNVTSTARELSEHLSAPFDEIWTKLMATSSNFITLAKDVPLETVDAIRAQPPAGIGVSKRLLRWYPEQGMGGQMLGFVAATDEKGRAGKYGIEGFFNDSLVGQAGSLVTEKDAAGRRLTIVNTQFKPARNGAHVVLTIDRVIQYQACAKMAEAVQRFQARGASVVIMDPYSGAILGMCAAPDFDPARVGMIKDVAVLNNPVTFYEYEPGSIFKPFTMAAGLDAGKITPDTTYVDGGAEAIDGFTIRNSDKEAHGLQTMTKVLELSLNTGTIFVQRLLGKDVFQDYVQRFGFGEKTGVELKSEVAGDVDALARKGKIFAATASFGQGLTVTPLQMVQAYAALGNGGVLYKPHIVAEVIRPDGSRDVTQPQVLRRVLQPRTSQLISAMMVNVVERGHGKRAGVPGYYVAGKTGTAQVPNPNGRGYLEDETIGSFAGFAPAEHPAFVMLVKIDHPRTVKFAESSAAPIFGELAAFLLSYLQVPTERPVIVRPSLAAVSSTSPAR